MPQAGGRTAVRSPHARPRSRPRGPAAGHPAVPRLPPDGRAPLHSGRDRRPDRRRRPAAAPPAGADLADVPGAAGGHGPADPGGLPSRRQRHRPGRQLAADPRVQVQHHPDAPAGRHSGRGAASVHPRAGHADHTLLPCTVRHPHRPAAGPPRLRHLRGPEAESRAAGTRRGTPRTPDRLPAHLRRDHAHHLHPRRRRRHPVPAAAVGLARPRRPGQHLLVRRSRPRTARPGRRAPQPEPGGNS